MSPLLLDLVFIGLGILMFFVGFRRGLVGQVVWFFSSFVGFALAARFAADLAEIMQYSIVSKPITIAVSFLLIFLVVVWLARRIGIWITHMIHKSLAGAVNSALGAVFNLALYVVIAVLLTILVMVVVPDSRETVQKTYVLQTVLEPVKAFMDERILRRSDIKL